MNEKNLLEQRRKINALYRERIRKKQLAKAIEIVISISTIIIFVLSIAVLIIWIFNL